MKAFGKIIAKYKILVILVCVALLVPSAIGYIRTKVNYDILSYLPNSLETVYGQDIMVQDFGKGAFSMVIVEGMGKRDAAKLEDWGWRCRSRCCPSASARCSSRVTLR